MIVPLAKSCTLDEAKEMMEIASAALRPTRFEQTGVAWLMAELSISQKRISCYVGRRTQISPNERGIRSSFEEIT